MEVQSRKEEEISDKEGRREDLGGIAIEEKKERKTRIEKQYSNSEDGKRKSGWQQKRDLEKMEVQ